MGGSRKIRRRATGSSCGVGAGFSFFSLRPSLPSSLSLSLSVTVTYRAHPYFLAIHRSNSTGPFTMLALAPAPEANVRPCVRALMRQCTFQVAVMIIDSYTTNALANSAVTPQHASDVPLQNSELQAIDSRRDPVSPLATPTLHFPPLSTHRPVTGTG